MGVAAQRLVLLGSFVALTLAPFAIEAAGGPEKIEHMRAAAATTLDSGDFVGAKSQFDEIVALVPRDAAAQRDAGRAAMAAGQFEYAARVLERSHHFGGHHRDPELHYLRGEALYELGLSSEARGEHRIAELEIGEGALERTPRLWLGRIYARRGQLDRADRIYESLWPRNGQAPEAEIAINHAEAHILLKDWDGAEVLLRRFLARAPDHLRARQMLAWALEAKGDLDGELMVRARLAADEPSSVIHQDYGRALERARDWGHAFAAYETAATLSSVPNTTIVGARDRMHYRTTPEITLGLLMRSDPSATAQHLQAGLALPFGSRHLISVLAGHDTLQGGFPPASGSASALGLSLVLGGRRGGTLMLGGQVRSTNHATAAGADALQIKQDLAFGGVSQVTVALANRLHVDLQGELQNQWTETPLTVQSGGAVTGVTGHAFIFPLAGTRRVLIDAGAQGRTLTLAPRGQDEPRPRASQLLAWTGVDFVLWHDPARVLTGQILDESLVRSADFADSVTLSLRHYELFGSASSDFKSRIALVDRSSIENAGLVIRSVLAGGRACLDARTGVGYDLVRDRLLTQAGLAILIATTAATRVSFSYEIAHETTTGLVGTRHGGWLSYHADL